MSNYTTTEEIMALIAVAVLMFVLVWVLIQAIYRADDY